MLYVVGVIPRTWVICEAVTYSTSPIIMGSGHDTCNDVEDSEVTMGAEGLAGYVDVTSPERIRLAPVILTSRISVASPVVLLIKYNFPCTGSTR